MTPSASASPKGRPANETGSLLEETLRAAGSVEKDPALFALRSEAKAWLEQRGFPKPKEEAWRFTPVAPLLGVPYSRTQSPSPGGSGGIPAKAAEALGALAAFSLSGERRVVLENGVPRAPGEDKSGVTVSSIRAALARDPSRVLPYLGKIAPVRDGFVAQNAALFGDGLVVTVESGATGNVVHLVRASVSSGAPALATPRLLVILQPGSELTLVESDASDLRAPFLDTSVTEIVVGRGARLEHVRVRSGAALKSRLSALAVRQEAGSSYSSRVFSFGGLLEREDLSVTFSGEGAECSLEGLSFAGSGELVDHHTLVDHATPRCTSRQRYKAIVDGTGVAVFDGTVAVRHGAARTAAHQESRNLLLSKDAVLHTKPHLEIDTDDVVCSHGATVGQLDPTQLFYLRSRGIELSLARSVLLYAFARDVAAAIRDADLRSAIEDSIAAFLPDGALARELT